MSASEKGDKKAQNSRLDYTFVHQLFKHFQPPLIYWLRVRTWHRL